jgi:membrane associated rhomboid family serine protease
MVVFLALIWILQVANWADGYRLDADFGILPHHVSRIPDIFTAPFLHFNWQHIEGNSLPLFVLGFLTAYRGVVKFLLVTFIVAVVSGLGVWLFQSSTELTVGASGLIFGYFGYVLLRGIFDRNLIDIGVGVGAALLYWGILSVAIPGTPGISWIGHLTGLIGGVLAAWLLRAPRPSLAGGGSGADRLIDRAGGPSGAGRGRWGRPGSGAGGPDTAGSGPADRGSADRGSAGSANDGRTRPLPETDTDRLLREIEETGI